MKEIKTLVIQPRSGIGDMIWHLPYIRTLKRDIAKGPIYLLTKSKNLAKTWLYNESSIAQIDYLDRRRLITTGLKLRHQHFEQAWILHPSTSYALVAFIAGIPKRIGLNRKDHSFLLTHAPLNNEERSAYHLQQLDALFRYYNIDVRPEDQQITLDPLALQFVKDRFKNYPQPWICLGIGASEEFKIWPANNFVDMAQQIDEYYSDQFNSTNPRCTFFICGSKSESLAIESTTHEMTQRSIQAVAVNDMTLPQMFALLSLSSLFIGNDSGLLNASCCLNTPSVGLFGSSPPLTYSPNIYGIVPSRPTYGHRKGMLALTTDSVMHYILQKQLLHFNESSLLKGI